MKRAALIGFAVCLLTLPVSAGAQTDPSHTYSDPAMSYTAPADFTPIPVPSASPDAFEKPTIVAAFVTNLKRPDSNVITLQMENYTDDLQSYEGQAESQARNRGSDSVFVKKELTTLSNGMPAYFLNITVSQDSGQLRIFEYVWVDHVRGVVLSVVGHFGTIDETGAKKILSNVSAVAYPRNQF